MEPEKVLESLQSQFIEVDETAIDDCSGCDKHNTNVIKFQLEPGDTAWMCLCFKCLIKLAYLIPTPEVKPELRNQQQKYDYDNNYQPDPIRNDPFDDFDFLFH